MYKYLLIITMFFLFSGCVNRHGISAKYYSDCNEYYDLQGYYHKVCGKDDIITYKKMGEVADEVINGEKEEPTSNVY